jgi:hypothetical protein
LRFAEERNPEKLSPTVAEFALTKIIESAKKDYSENGSREIIKNYYSAGDRPFGFR